MVERLPSKQYVVGSNLALAALFSFSVKKKLFRQVQVSCIDLFIYVGLRVFMCLRLFMRFKKIMGFCPFDQN